MTNQQPPTRAEVEEVHGDLLNAQAQLRLVGTQKSTPIPTRIALSTALRLTHSAEALLRRLLHLAAPKESK